MTKLGAVGEPRGEVSGLPHPATGVASCPLVLGECVQGKLRDGPHFLITAPIQRFSWARFDVRPELGRVVVDPPDRSKSRAAVERYLAQEGLPCTGVLRVHTPLQPAHGFGTSTADITSSLSAVAAAWGRTITPEAISRIAIGIEPTDGSMYDGSVAYAHCTGSLLEDLGKLPPFEALAVCIGQGIDTVEFDQVRKDFRYSARDEKRLVSAWAMVRRANRRQDLALFEPGQAT